MAGWSNVSETGGAISVNTLGGIDITTGATNSNEGKVAQVFTTEADREYELTLTTVDLITADLGTSSTGSQISSTDLTSGISTITFTASTSTTYLTFRNFDNTNGTSNVNNVSLKQIVNSVHDYSKNENGGVLYTGKALEFDGIGDNVNCGVAPQVTNLTIPVWIKQDNVSGVYECICYADVDNSEGYQIFIDNNNKLAFGIYTSSFTRMTSTTTLSADTSYRAICTYDGSNMKIYLNGSLDATQAKTGSIAYSTNPNLYLGSNDNPSEYFDGSLANIQIYDKAWTATDVKYDWEHPEKDVFDNIDSSILETDCKALYRLNEGAGDKVFNSAVVLGEDIVSNGGFDSYGSDIVVNGDFSTTGTWNSGTIDTTAGTLTLPTGNTGLVYQTYSGSLSNKNFLVTVDIAALPNAATLYLGETEVSIPSVGINTFNITPSGSNAFIGFNNGGSMVVNSLKVQPLSDWNIDDGTSWSTLNEKAYCNGDDGFIKQTGASKSIGDLFLVEFDVSASNNTGDLGVRIGGSSYIWGLTSNGHHEHIIEVIASTTEDILLYATGGWEGSIDNISVKQITPASAAQSYTNATTAGATWVNAQRDIPQLGMVSYSKKMIFDGSNDYVEVADDSAINMGTSDFTLALTALINSHTGADQRLIDKRGSKGYGLKFKHSSGSSLGKIGLEMRDGTKIYDINLSDSAINLGELTSIIVSLDRSGYATCYINGVAHTPVDISECQDSLDDTTALLFGGDTPTGTNSNLDGFVDEVSIFNKALTSTEVVELYNAGTALDARDHSESANLLGYWRNNGTDDWDDLTLDHYVRDIDSTTIANGWYTLYEFDSFSNSNGVISISDNDTSPPANASHSNWFSIKSISGSGNLFTHDSNGSEWVYNVGDVIEKEIDITISAGTSLAIFDYNVNDEGGSGHRYASIPSSEIPFATTYMKIKFEIVTQETHPSGAFKKFELKDLSVKFLKPESEANHGTVNGSPETIILQEGVLFGKDSLGLPMNKVREKGLNLDGTGYVQVADDDTLDFGTGDFSLEAWVKGAYINRASSINVIISLGNDADGSTSASLVSSNANKLGFWCNSSIYADNVYSSNQWYHIVGVRDDGEMKLYIDSNQQTATATVSTNVTNTQIKFIGSDTSSSRIYTDLIDEPRVYNRALSAKEIKKNYKAGLSQHKNNTVSNWSDDFTDDFI